MPSPINPGEAKDTQDLILAKTGIRAQETTAQEVGTDRVSDITNNTSNSSIPQPNETRKPITASGWLEWVGVTNREGKPHSQLSQNRTSIIDSEVNPTKFIKQQSSQALSVTDQLLSKRRTVSSSKGESTTVAPISESSWFNIWQSPASNKNTTNVNPINDLRTDVTAQETQVAETPFRVDHKKPPPSSTWAFWSRDSRRPVEKGPKAEEPSEVAVTSATTQDSPNPAHATVLGENRGDRVKKSYKRGRQLPDDVQEPVPKTLHSDMSNKRHAPQAVSVMPSEFIQKAAPPQTPIPSKAAPANLLLPSFKSTYRLVENPSIIQQIARFLMHSQQTPASHVYLVKEPPKIKKALAIGIHGLFPAPLLRTVIGQPTGTSIRFANHAAAAIHRWASIHESDCEVEKVALEGEGKIAERVDSLWELLLNWINHVRSADLIMVACHSQGVPVALMLVAKLIEFGVVTSARIGVCAMAGVSLGPFADYNSRLFTGSAAELFDFANQDSEVSKRYESSLRVALSYGVRVSFIGSIDDQLISLESAIFSPVNHPYIYRAVFVDGRVHAPDFIAHLVGFALKLRNLGISDHGLLRELSAPLAGSLYTGEGHSRLYDEVRIYDDAISFTLETTSIGDVPLQVRKFEIPTNSNPFQLPWSMRGLLEEDIVKTELDQETAELLRQFEKWKPTTKVLKDVKYRLEAIKSKL